MEFKLKEKKVGKKLAYFELVNESQVTGSICWMQGKHLMVINYIMTDIKNYSKNMLEDIFKGIKPLDVKAFKKKMKTYRTGQG